MPHFELRCPEVPLKKPLVANVVRGQYTHAPRRWKRASYMATQRIQHVDDLHRRVLLQLIDERVAQKARQKNTRDAALFEIADHVEDVQLALGRRSARLACIAKRTLFEQDVEVLRITMRGTCLNQLEKYIRAGERPKPADHAKHPPVS